MPYLLVRFALLFACLCAGPVWAAGPVPANTIVVGDGTPSFEVSTDIQTWLDTNSKADIALVSVFPKLFTAVPALHRHGLSDRDTLWIKLRLLRTVGNTASWTLNIAQPTLDAVTLFQRKGPDGWTEQNAGDQFAQAEWSKKGLYPEFELNLPAGVPQDVYLRVRNYQHVSLPLRIAAAPTRESQRLLEMVLLGLMLGTLLALATLSAVRYAEHGNWADILASTYGLLVLMAVAQINGVLNVFVWATLPLWGNYASSVIPMVAVGAGLLFVRNLYALSTHYHRYDVFLGSTAWLTMASVLSLAVVDRASADKFCTLAMTFAITVGLAATALSWRGNSSIWRWLILAYVPQYAGLMWLLADSLGLVPSVWEMRYITSVSASLSVPILLYALSRVTHDRKELEMRANHLPTQDALTGLLTPQAFHLQLEEAYERIVSNREPMALVLVRVINHEPIRQSLGDALAEQCLLRAVVKLHRILRDVDPAGRVDTAHFAILLEGVPTRQALTERMVQLIASGLIPLPGLTPPVTLQFQAACVLLHENPVPPEEALSHLHALLATMSAHTRRPIRFLDAVPTQAATLRAEMSPT